MSEDTKSNANGDEKPKDNIRPIGLKYDADEVERFWRAFAGTRHVTLTAIHPLNKKEQITARTFKVEKSFGPLHKWARELNEAGYGIYFNPADLGPKFSRSKATKSDVLSVDCLWVDLDPDKSDPDLRGAKAALIAALTANLPEGLPKPSLVIDSGNGAWGFWKLSQPVFLGQGADRVEDQASVEERNNWLRLLPWPSDDGDACFNIDRVARLPGTINHPNQRKLDAGMGRSMARYLADASDPGRVYALTDFERVEIEGRRSPGGGEQVSGDDLKPVKLDEVERRTSAETRSVIEFMRNADGPIADRSAGVWHVVCAMIRGGFGDDEIRYVLLNQGWKVSEHIYEQLRGPLHAANRQIERGRAVESAKAVDFRRLPNNTPYPNDAANIEIALGRNGLFPRVDQFTEKTHIDGLERLTGSSVVVSSDAYAILASHFDEQHGLKCAPQTISGTVLKLAHRHRSDPLNDYLNGVEWDGVCRIETFLSDFLGVEDSRLNRYYSEHFFRFAVGRALRPGYSSRGMLVLVGEEWVGKSSLLMALSPRKEWVNTSLTLKADSKQAIEEMKGKWFAEFAEMEGIRGAQGTHIKAFLTRNTDTARTAYKSDASETSRRWIPIGTSNLRDDVPASLGTTRLHFVTIPAGWQIDVDAVAEIRDLLWAEAVEGLRSGPKLIMDEELMAAHMINTGEMMQDDPIEVTISDLFGEAEEGQEMAGNVHIGKIRAQDVYDMAFGGRRLNGPQMRDVKKAMLRIGFKYSEKVRFRNDAPQMKRGFVRWPFDDGRSSGDIPEIDVLLDDCEGRKAVGLGRLVLSSGEFVETPF